MASIGDVENAVAILAHIEKPAAGPGRSHAVNGCCAIRCEVIAKVTSTICNNASIRDVKHAGARSPNVEIKAVGPGGTRSIDCCSAVHPSFGMDGVTDFSAKIRDVRSVGDVERAASAIADSEVGAHGQC